MSEEAKTLEEPRTLLDLATHTAELLRRQFDSEAEWSVVVATSLNKQFQKCERVAIIIKKRARKSTVKDLTFTCILELPHSPSAVQQDVKSNCVCYKYYGFQNTDFPDDPAVYSTSESWLNPNDTKTRSWRGWRSLQYGYSIPTLFPRDCFEAKTLDYVCNALQKKESTDRHSPQNRWRQHLTERSRCLWTLPELLRDDLTEEEEHEEQEANQHKATSQNLFEFYGPQMDVGSLLRDGWIAPARRPETAATTVQPLPPRPVPPLNPIAYVLYAGQRDSSSILSKLPLFLVQKIYVDHVVPFYKSQINYSGVFASVVARVKFPPPTGIQINMMPIIIGNTFSIPEEYRAYIPLLLACPVNRQEFGKIGYLTIHESEIATDQTSQRRRGIHTESPGVVHYCPDTYTVVQPGKWAEQMQAPLTVAWGRGIYHEGFGCESTFEGGLYMASNVDQSTKVWNCEITSSSATVDRHGGLKEEVHYFLDEGNCLSAGEMCWMTDATPHASLPLKKGTQRQYFRLVTSEVSAWYAEHSTKNPLGIVPPEGVVILQGSKFVGDATKKGHDTVEMRATVGEETSTTCGGESKATEANSSVKTFSDPRFGPKKKRAVWQKRPEPAPAPGAAAPAAAPAAAAPAAAPTSATLGQYTYAQLKGNPCEVQSDIDVKVKETYLSDAEFQDVFKMDRTAFGGQPGWKKKKAKVGAGLF